MNDSIPSETSARKRRSSVGSKVAIGLALTILLGIAALVYFGGDQQRNNLQTMSGEYRELITRQLGARISGGLRWSRVEAIETAYADFVIDETYEVSDIVVFGTEGNIVTEYHSKERENAELSNTAKSGAGRSGARDKAVIEGDHMIIVFYGRVLSDLACLFSQACCCLR
jgi:hypothetical protein